MAIKKVAINDDWRTGDPMVDLAAGVVRQALWDYEHMRMLGRKTREGEDAERFIRSREFTIWTLDEVDGEALLLQIDRMCEKRRKGK